VTALTDVSEARVLNWVTGNAGATAPTGPLKVRLMTANGSDSAAGTEVAGGTYAPQNAGFAAASSGTPSANAADIEFDDMPACTVVGVEIWDSNGTPFRWAYGALAVSRAVAAGSLFRIAAGDLTLTAS
jgi:hypothetical protein